MQSKLATPCEGNSIAAVSRKMGRTKKSSLQSPKEATPAQTMGDKRKSRPTRNMKTSVQVATCAMATEGQVAENKYASCCRSAEEAPVVKSLLRQKRKLTGERTADSDPKKRNASKKKSCVVTSRQSSKSSKRFVKQDSPSAEEHPHSAATSLISKAGAQSGKPNSRSSRRNLGKDVCEGAENSGCCAADSDATLDLETKSTPGDSSGHAGTGSGKLVGSHCSIAGWYHCGQCQE